MLTQPRSRVDPRCALVRSRLADIFVGDCSDFGAIPVAVVSKHRRTMAKLSGCFASGEASEHDRDAE